MNYSSTKTLQLEKIVKAGGIPLKLDGYRMKDEDTICYEIYDLLKELFEASRVIEDTPLNLVAVFFYDFLRIFTHFACCAFEIKCCKQDLSVNDYEPLSRFPYTDYLDVLDQNYLSKIITSQLDSLGNSKKVIMYYKFFNVLGLRNYVGVLPVGHLQNKILKCLNVRGIWSSPVREQKIAIPTFTRQWQFIQEGLRAICAKLGVTNQKGLLSILEQHVSTYVIKDAVNQKLPFSLLVSGTLLKRESRFIAAICRSQNIPVLMVSHGEGDQFISEEPRTGYGEMTFASHVLAFGKIVDKSLKESPRLQGFFGAPRILYGSSDLCLQNKTNCSFKKINLLSNNVLYIGSDFKDKMRYGPSLTLPSVLYLEWLNQFFKEFPKVTFKPHPKRTFDLTLQGVSIEEGKLEEVVHNYDYVIVDIFTTAFNVVAATEKPIVYFDFGKRPPLPSVEILIRKRCYWVDVKDFPDRQKVLQRLQLQVEDYKSNEYTEEVCLGAGRKPRISQIITAVKAIRREVVK